MPLPHKRGRVPGRPEPLGDRVRFERQVIQHLGGQQLRVLGRELRPIWHVVRNPHAGWSPAGEDRRAEEPVRRFSILAPEGTSLRGNMELSPDGQTLWFVASVPLSASLNDQRPFCPLTSLSLPSSFFIPFLF